MFSDKENINILTALLLKHGVREAVVCPGSRNAPIVHNLSEAGMHCHPVTDERSAGFCALGISLARKAPVVVCVTSGSALLNLAPAVAEASYRQVPLVVVSADRPAERIEQLDGQTIPQPGALGRFVALSVSLPEPHDSPSRSHCNRLVNETLLEAHRCPVHINVPITEPLFRFSVEKLPDERVIKRISEQDSLSLFRVSSTSLGEFGEGLAALILRRLQSASRPMIVVGQCPRSQSLSDSIEQIKRRVTVLHEPLSSEYGGVPFDDALDSTLPSLAGRAGAGLHPDFILYIGNTIVSKRLKSFLRQSPDAETWAISEDGKVHDTFGNQTAVLQCDAGQTMAALAEGIPSVEASEYHSLWNKALAAAAERTNGNVSSYSEELAVRLFEESLESTDSHVHYANSTAVRLACCHARHYVYVNRGVNGIEGSLSTAAGFSLASQGKTFCVIGDLSFFYDSNALWNQRLDGRLRILLLNNGGGQIFRTLPGLEQSPVRDICVMGAHTATAAGLCRTHGIEYLSVSNEEELRAQLPAFLNGESSRPVVLEVLFSPSPA